MSADNSDYVYRAQNWLTVLENARGSDIGLKAAIAALAYTNLALIEQEAATPQVPVEVKAEKAWPVVRDAALIDELTNREKEILWLTMEGHSNGKMAKMLWVTEQTIKFHLSNIYRKLGVSNRTEASRWAHRNLNNDESENVA